MTKKNNIPLVKNRGYRAAEMTSLFVFDFRHSQILPAVF